MSADDCSSKEIPWTGQVGRDPLSLLLQVNDNRKAEAARSWKYLCQQTGAPLTHSCCVSFSASFNTSDPPSDYLASREAPPFFIAPCPVCSCGCAPHSVPSHFANSTVVSPSCPTSGECRWLLCCGQWLILALTLLAGGFLYPKLTGGGDVAPYQLRSLPLGSSRCGDSCPIHVHWHVMSIYKDGWVAKASGSISQNLCYCPSLTIHVNSHLCICCSYPLRTAIIALCRIGMLQSAWLPCRTSALRTPS